MHRAITEKTEMIVNKMDSLLSKALGGSGIGTFASMSDSEAILFKDAMALMKDLDELLVDYGEALDKIHDLSFKLDSLQNDITRQNEYTNEQFKELTELVRKMSESKSK